MMKIAIGLAGKEPLPIKKGFPRRFKKRKFHNATCYHIEVTPDEFLLFQNILVGPFSCWYTEYFCKSRFFYSDMISNGVEFHSMIEGAAMYKMDGHDFWFIESKGAHNILVNPPNKSITGFTSVPVMTFDIHITVEHFIALTDIYPSLKQLLPAIASGKMGTLFADKEESSLQLKGQISQILGLFEQQTDKITIEQEQHLINLFNEVIASYASSNTSEGTSIKITQAEMDKVFQIKHYITEHYMDSRVIAVALSKYPIPPEKLKNCFKALFNHLPKSFLINERIKIAKSFMKNNPTAKKVEIAMSVGYLDANYLNKLFIRLEGCSIEQYRQKLKEG